MKSLLPALFVFTMLCGCAVEGKPFQRASAPAGTAVIYVYRPYTYACSALRPPVTCAEDTARIGAGGYHAFIVPAGNPVTCTVPGETTDQVEIHPDPRVYYLKEECGWGLLSGHFHLDPIDADQAHDEIRSCCVDEQNPAP